MSTQQRGDALDSLLLGLTQSSARTDAIVHPHQRTAQLAKSALQAVVLNPLDELRALATNYLDIAVAAAKDLTNPAPPSPGGPPNSAVETLDPIETRKALRGAALLNGMLAAGPAGNAVKTAGARILAQSPLSPAATRAALGAGQGVAEGAAFGATFGALEPLDDEHRSRLDAIAFNTVSGAIFGGVLRGVGAARQGKKSEVHDDIVEGLRAASRDEAAGRHVALQLARQQLPPEPLVPSELAAQVAAGVTRQGPTRSGIAAHLTNAVGGLRDLVQTRFPAVKKLDESTWMAALRAADSRYFGAWFGKRSAQFVQEGLSEQERSIFWRGLIASRGRQIRTSLAQEAEALELSGETIKINGKVYDAQGVRTLSQNVNIADLPPTEQALFDASPAIRQARARYENDVLPLLTEVRTRNGLRTLAETDEPFLPLLGATEADIKAGIAAFGSPRGATSGFEQTFAALTTPGAKRATGSAFGYVADGEVLLTRIFSKEFAVDRKNELLANIIEAPWAHRLARGERAPRTVMWQGREVPAAVIDITGNPRVLSERFGVSKITREVVPQEPPTPIAGLLPPARPSLPAGPGQALVRSPGEELSPFLMDGEVAALEGLGGIPGEVAEPVLGKYVVPKPIAKMINEMFNPLDDRVIDPTVLTENTFLRGLMKFQDFSVGLLLASPVEVTAHSSRILAILARIPGVGNDQGALAHLSSKLIPYFGPRLGALKSIYNVYANPEALAMEARLARIPGGVPSRAFESEFGAVHGIVGGKTGKALEHGRKFIFDLPAQKQGLHGFDIRARVSAGLALDRITMKELGRKATDKELSEFLTQFGQYSESVQSSLAASLRKLRMNPFAGGQAGIIPGEIRSFFGGLNLPKETVEQFSAGTEAKLRAEILYRGTFGTALMLSVTQYALTKRWPWQNERGRETDLMVGYTEDGKGAYVPFHTFEPGIARAAHITGVRAVLESFGEDVVKGATLDLANIAITYGFGAPGVGAAATLLTGSAPFLTGEGQILRTVPPQPTATLTAKERFLSAAGVANPTIENFLGVGHSAELPGGIRIVNAISPGMEVGREPLMALSADVRARRAQEFEILEERVTRGLQKFPTYGERVRFYREESEKFPDRKQQLEAFRTLLLLDQRRRQGRVRSAGEALREGERF